MPCRGAGAAPNKSAYGLRPPARTFRTSLTRMFPAVGPDGAGCFPHWLDGPPQTKLLGFIGDNLDGYATEQIAIAESALTRAPR